MFIIIAHVYEDLESNSERITAKIATKSAIIKFLLAELLLEGLLLEILVDACSSSRSLSISVVFFTSGSAY